MTHNEFKAKYLWKWIDFDGAYWSQCVDLPDAYCKFVYGFDMWPVGGSAKNTSLAQTFHNDKRRKMYLPDKWVPLKMWDVLVSAPTATNPHWHIWIFDSQDTLGYNLLEQNTAGGGTRIKANAIKVRHVKWGKPPILKFFRFTPSAK